LHGHRRYSRFSGNYRRKRSSEKQSGRKHIIHLHDRIVLLSQLMARALWQRISSIAREFSSPDPPEYQLRLI
jgi:hypothetical protein